MWVPDTLISNSSTWFFLSCQVVCSCSALYFMKTLCNSLWVSLYRFFSSPVLCPMNSDFLGFLRLSALFPELRESIGLCLSYPTAPWSRNSLKVIGWGSHRVYLVYFLFLKDHCSTLPVFQCLEHCCFTYFCACFYVSGRRVNMIPPISYCLESVYIWKEFLSDII